MTIFARRVWVGSYAAVSEQALEWPQWGQVEDPLELVYGRFLEK